ncbi:MAG: DUF2892 domain-containing protein [Nitrospirae bacterium]|nr:DUF2892 domain-containing protein [Nitrospirota bacterium]
MKANIGSADRTIRIVAGLAAIGLGVYFKSWLGVIGLVPLITSFIGWCPLYSVFGFTSCGTSSCCGSAACETHK